MDVQPWKARWHQLTTGMSLPAQVAVVVGAAVVVVSLLLQLGHFALKDRSTNPAELEALTYYAEQLHNSALFSLRAGRLERVPAGDCLAGYTVAGATLEPARTTRRLMKACEVSVDNTALPVVRVTHRDGTVVSVP